MNNYLIPKSVKLYERGLTFDEKTFEEIGCDTEILFKDFFYIYHQENFSHEPFQALIEDTSKLNRIIIQLAKPMESFNLVEDYCRRNNYIGNIFLTRFKDHEHQSVITDEQFKNIKFLDDQKEITKYNEQMMNNWSRDYYDSFLYCREELRNKLRDNHHNHARNSLA